MSAAEPDLTRAVAAARNGDEQAFAAVFTALQPRVLRYLTGLGFADPADLAQETWLQVVRDLHRFDGDGDAFRRWLFTLARHRGLDAVRVAGRRPAPATDDPDEHLAGRAGAATAEDSALEALEIAKALRLLQVLPPEQADVVALRVLAGLDVAATAQVLGRSPGAVRVASHRGLRRLAELHQTPEHLRRGVSP